MVPPQPQISAKDKGKNIMQELEKPVKLKSKDQIAYDKEVAQRLQEELDEEVRLEREREEEASNAALIEQWDNVQAMMDADYELATRIRAQERGKLTIEERSKLFVELINERKKHFARLRAEEQRRKPPTKSLKRNQMCTYLKNIEVVKGSEKKAESSGKKTASKKIAGEKLDDESVKKQKIEDDAEKEELRACLDIIPGDDVAINVESLATKYPIIDWKTRILTENMIYYQIIRANGSSKNYKIFSEMLDDFDRQDV
ncbi:hypothetical protein Tco_1448391 [Tanacetum coccineum]